ncbi:MAG: hypothetical protein JXQ73_29175 [Phycisphaerae bacterium]|nr:hypothetical protein [Phycisphaerae bacterium]
METPLFTGAYEYTVDAKNRMSIPSQFRNQMDFENDGRRFYMVPGLEKGTLSLYPERVFRQLDQSWPKPKIPSRDFANYRRVFYNLATLVEMDKQGRILLPQSLLNLANLGREVYITGSGDHLDICNKADYEAFMSDNWSQYGELQERVRQYLDQYEGGGEGNG